MAAARQLRREAAAREAIPVRKSFVRCGGGEDDSPMARLYRGGRSNKVAVKLLLALIWKSARKPYDTDVPASAWAVLLDLPDPQRAGQRAVIRAVHALEEANLITVLRSPGRTPEITLLEEDGSGNQYFPPSETYTRAKRKSDRAAMARHLYFKVPTRLWTGGIMQTLSGPALVVLLALLAEEAGDGKTVWYATGKFSEWYGLSHKTRTEGVKELSDRSLLKVIPQPVKPSANTARFGTKPRRRHTYTLQAEAANEPSKSARKPKPTPTAVCTIMTT